MGNQCQQQFRFSGSFYKQNGRRANLNGNSFVYAHRNGCGGVPPEQGLCWPEPTENGSRQTGCAQRYQGRIPKMIYWHLGDVKLISPSELNFCSRSDKAHSASWGPSSLNRETHRIPEISMASDTWEISYTIPFEDNPKDDYQIITRVLRVRVLTLRHQMPLDKGLSFTCVGPPQQVHRSHLIKFHNSKISFHLWDPRDFPRYRFKTL